MNQITLLQREIKELKENQIEAAGLFKQLKTQVGTHYGEQIDEHLAKIEGRRHNPNDWNMADLNGEQGR